MKDNREVIFKIENLQTWFPITKGMFKKVVGHVKAVDDVSLEVYKGETLGIVDVYKRQAFWEPRIWRKRCCKESNNRQQAAPAAHCNPQKCQPRFPVPGPAVGILHPHPKTYFTATLPNLHNQTSRFHASAFLPP